MHFDNTEENSWSAHRARVDNGCNLHAQQHERRLPCFIRHVRCHLNSVHERDNSGNDSPRTKSISNCAAGLPFSVGTYKNAVENTPSALMRCLVDQLSLAIIGHGSKKMLRSNSKFRTEPTMDQTALCSVFFDMSSHDSPALGLAYAIWKPMLSTNATKVAPRAARMASFMVRSMTKVWCISKKMEILASTPPVMPSIDRAKSICFVACREPLDSDAGWPTKELNLPS